VIGFAAKQLPGQTNKYWEAWIEKNKRLVKARI
jgi:hypothetical protein